MLIGGGTCGAEVTVIDLFSEGNPSDLFFEGKPSDCIFFSYS